MAVISCPGCNKKISDKASNCSHCGLELKGLDPEKISRLSNTKKNRKSSTFNELFFFKHVVILWWLLIYVLG
jgi:predicted amidophosphoribosyltransferase